MYVTTSKNIRMKKHAYTHHYPYIHVYIYIYLIFRDAHIYPPNHPSTPTVSAVFSTKKHVASMRKERSKAKPKAVRATSPEEFDGWITDRWFHSDRNKSLSFFCWGLSMFFSIWHALMDYWWFQRSSCEVGMLHMYCFSNLKHIWNMSLGSTTDRKMVETNEKSRARKLMSSFREYFLNSCIIHYNHISKKSLQNQNLCFCLNAFILSASPFLCASKTPP